MKLPLCHEEVGGGMLIDAIRQRTHPVTTVVVQP